MQRDQVTDAVSGGYIVQHTMDLLHKRLIFRVEVLASGVMTAHDLEFVSISEFMFRDERGGLWEFLELRELVLDQSPEQSASEEWKVFMNFWDTAYVELRCAQIVFNGTRVA